MNIGGRIAGVIRHANPAKMACSAMLVGTRREGASGQLGQDSGNNCGADEITLRSQVFQHRGCRRNQALFLGQTHNRCGARNGQCLALSLDAPNSIVHQQQNRPLLTTPLERQRDRRRFTGINPGIQRLIRQII